MQNTQTQQSIMIDGQMFTITAEAYDNGWAPTATDEQGNNVYLGGEDDEDDATPTEALARGARYLREQRERGQYKVIFLSADRLGYPVEQEDVDRYNGLLAEEIAAVGLDKQYRIELTLDGGLDGWSPRNEHADLYDAMERAWIRFERGQEAADA